MTWMQGLVELAFIGVPTLLIALLLAGGRGQKGER
jgi:hypothetical protein